MKKSYLADRVQLVPPRPNPTEDSTAAAGQDQEA